VNQRERELLALFLTVPFLVSLVGSGGLFGGFADFFIFVFISVLGGDGAIVAFIGWDEFATLVGGTATRTAELIVLEKEGEDDGYPGLW